MSQARPWQRRAKQASQDKTESLVNQEPQATLVSQDSLVFLVYRAPKETLAFQASDCQDLQELKVSQGQRGYQEHQVDPVDPEWMAFLDSLASLELRESLVSGCPALRDPRDSPVVKDSPDPKEIPVSLATLEDLEVPGSMAAPELKVILVSLVLLVLVAPQGAQLRGAWGPKDPLDLPASWGTQDILVTMVRRATLDLLAWTFREHLETEVLQGSPVLPDLLDQQEDLEDLGGTDCLGCLVLREKWD